MASSISIPDNLENLSKQELISILKNIKESTYDQHQNKSSVKTKLKRKEFDFKRYKKRHVALKILYLGWDYSGFVTQINSDKTIEEKIFSALEKTKLLESRENSNYHRCGRTDKGVSAFSQVISLDLRSNLLEGKGIITPEDFKFDDDKARNNEIDYTSILNRVLPPEIKIIAWAPVEHNFSARFDCLQRTYKYWFPIANLNVEKMKIAAQKLIGEHDFRNLCKMDVANGVVNYMRRIINVNLINLNDSKNNPYEIAELTIVGQAFLYHQIRCIVSILFLVGQGKEDPEIIDNLLDITKYPRKPQYNMVSEIPLVLFDCSFDDIEWNYDRVSLKFVIENLQNIWTHHTIKSTIIRRMLSELEKIYGEDETIIHQLESLQPGDKSQIYKRLLDRQCCNSLEEKIQHYEKKRKLNNQKF